MKPVWYALATGLVSYLLAGISGWAAFVVSFLVFLFTGGRNMATHAYKTLPRDFSYVRVHALTGRAAFLALVLVQIARYYRTSVCLG